MALVVRTVIVLAGMLALAAGAPLATAAPADQAATATPTAVRGATSTPVPCVVPPTGVVIILENPSPGDTLLSGTQVVLNGIAYDTGATTGSGIASVVIYLGDRTQGGLSLGPATLGQPNPTAAPGTQFANAGFTLRTPALPSGSGARSIFVYARSLVGNAEASLEVPIYLNRAPTPTRGQNPTPVLPPPAACTPTPTPTSTAVATDTPVAAAAAVATSTPIVVRPTPTLFTAPAPLAPAPAPPVAAPAPQPAVPPVAAVPATAQATAPRAGGIPSEIGLLLLGIGAAVVGGGLALRRRERGTSHRDR